MEAKEVENILGTVPTAQGTRAEPMMSGDLPGFGLKLRKKKKD